MGIKMRFILFSLFSLEILALDWRIKKAAFNERNEKYQNILSSIDTADTFDEIQAIFKSMIEIELKELSFKIEKYSKYVENYKKEDDDDDDEDDKDDDDDDNEDEEEVTGSC